MRTQLKSPPGFMDVIQKRLAEKDVSPETAEHLLQLLHALLASIDLQPEPNNDLLIRLVDAFADQHEMIALINKQASELDALKHITVNLTSSLDLTQVLQGVVQEAMNLVRQSSEAHIFLTQGQKIVFGAFLNSTGDQKEQFSTPRPDGLIEKVIQGGKQIILEDVSQVACSKPMAGLWSGSMIAIPMKMGDRVIGVMTLLRSICGEFTASEIRLLGLLADQASIAIINARLHQAVSHQARSDVLTGLPNRRALDERLDEEIKKATQTDCVFCVLMMDLDDFKQINDTYGHEVGDEILRQVARSLQQNLRTSDFIARYGGDELTLVLTETDLNQAEVVIEKVKSSLDSLVLDLPDDSSLHMTISGGIALYPYHATTAPGLLRSADEALYRAKRSGGGTFLVAQKINA